MQAIPSPGHNLDKSSFKQYASHTQLQEGVMTVKERLKALIDDMPDDATYEQILRELAFGEMIDRGLDDARNDRSLSNEDMKKRIES